MPHYQAISICKNKVVYISVLKSRCFCEPDPGSSVCTAKNVNTNRLPFPQLSPIIRPGGIRTRDPRLLGKGDP
jgi:hypothetical protein